MMPLPPQGLESTCSDVAREDGFAIKQSSTSAAVSALVAAAHAAGAICHDRMSKSNKEKELASQNMLVIF
eukprot:5642045-Amphidinium_carterae.1